jgi:hypothetical protein
MATSGPDTGNAEFFITTGPAPGYDDRYSIFGHVVSGMEVVRAIAALPVAGTGTDAVPRQPPAIRGVTVERGEVRQGTLSHDVRIQTPTAGKVARPGGDAAFLLIVTNTGNARDTFRLEAAAPAGWEARFETPDVALPAGRSWVVLLNVTLPPDASGPGRVAVIAHSGKDPTRAAALWVGVTPGRLGVLPREGDAATGDYTGFLEDGRIFDTTVADLGTNASFVKMSSAFVRSSFAPYTFTVGHGTVKGFSTLAERTAVGESRVGRIAWTEAYAEGAARRDPLYHRPILFELRIDSVAPATAP